MESGDRTVVLYPSRLKFAAYLVLCAAFTVAGIMMIASGEAIGWLTAVFFGAGVVVFAVSMLPGASYLELTDDGFRVRSLFRSHTTLWRAVSEFRFGALASGRKSVVFDLAAGEPSSLLRSANRALAACEGALPDNYGMKPEALAALMNERLYRFRPKSAL